MDIRSFIDSIPNDCTIHPYMKELKQEYQKKLNSGVIEAAAVKTEEWLKNKDHEKAHNISDWLNTEKVYKTDRAHLASLVLKAYYKGYEAGRKLNSVLTPEEGDNIKNKKEEGFTMNFGGINFVDFKGVAELPQDLASAWVNVTGGLIGASYKPVLYVGTQVVNGVNHFIIAEQTIMNAASTKNLVTFVINIPAGSVGGKGASIVRIDPVNL